MFNNLKKYFHKLKSVLLKHFSKPELEFNKPLTSADVVRMIKNKQFNGLKKLMPQFNWGGKRLSRSKSALVVLGFVLGIALSAITGSPLPLLLSILSISCIARICTWHYLPPFLIIITICFGRS